MKISKHTMIYFIRKHGEVRFSGFKWLLLARKIIKDSNVEYKAVWHDEFKQKHVDIYPADIMKETTYDDCVSGRFVISQNQLMMELKLYDGDMAYGQPAGERITFFIPIKTWHKEINDLINYAAVDVAIQQIKEAEKEAYNNKVNELAIRILKGHEKWRK